MVVAFKSKKNIVYSFKYHVIWCPKYRRKVLIDGVNTRLKEILHEVVGKPIVLHELSAIALQRHLYS